MATTQHTLERLQTNLDESIGYRQSQNKTQLSPVPSPKDIGRRPLRNAARIQIDQVIPDPSQPRTEFSPAAIERLANSIQDQGQLAPIRVRWSAEHSKWVIVCGERRWRAVQAAGLETIDCQFIALKEKGLSSSCFPGCFAVNAFLYRTQLLLCVRVDETWWSCVGLNCGSFSGFTCNVLL